MWGVEVIADQSQHFASLFSHMDADAEGMYASGAEKCVSSWLYNNMPETDERKSWWRGDLSEDEIVSGTSMLPYCQVKFKFANVTSVPVIIFICAEKKWCLSPQKQNVT